MKTKRLFPIHFWPAFYKIFTHETYLYFDPGLVVPILSSYTNKHQGEVNPFYIILGQSSEWFLNYLISTKVFLKIWFHAKGETIRDMQTIIVFWYSFFKPLPYVWSFIIIGLLCYPIPRKTGQSITKSTCNHVIT